jgi:hypothetical protein
MKRKEPWMNRPLILSGITALLLAQILCLPLTSEALGQVTQNKGTVAATPMSAACGQELQQFCSGIQPGQGRLIQCLAGRPGDLPAACNIFVAQARQGCAPEPRRSVQCIKPSDTDPEIKRFDRVNYVLFNQTTPSTANLLIFLTGTFGKPPGPTAFLHAAADAGYRVISLDYNDEPAVNAYCPLKPSACSANFRRMRVYGDGISIDPSFDNSGAESIVNRLIKLLVYLDRKDPQQNWVHYLDNGMPNWSRIALAGQSQGAGMAAYMAKRQTVAGVILFSSPWDFVASNGRLQMMAPWLGMPAATPAERWFGGYHQRENEANLLAKSYAALRIPPQNIRVFKGDLPATQKAGQDKNPFHGEGLMNPVYAEERAFFLGRSP